MSETALIDSTTPNSAAELFALVGQLDEHDVAEFVLCEVGDADPDGSVLLTSPLVGLHVPAVVWYLEAHDRNGVVVIRAFFGSSRMITRTVLPASAAVVGTYASAIGSPRVGLTVPLVTCPMDCPSAVVTSYP